MAQTTNLNVSPYFDDFNENDNYYKVLFKPGVPVQARELTGLQSILQNQIAKFGQHFFKEGSKVIPGNTTYTNNFKCVVINKEYLGINVESYIDQILDQKIFGSTSGVSGTVVKIVKSTNSIDGEITLYIQYESQGIESADAVEFQNGENLVTNIDITSGPDNSSFIPAGESFASTFSFDCTATGAAFSINDGVYFIRGNFVTVNSETLILDQYNDNPTGRIGLKIFEETINSDEDSNLTDNSKGFNNFAAPGADRLKISCSLGIKAIDDFNDDDFVELATVRDGNLVTKTTTTQYNLIADELARRTFDESGDYITKPFSIKARESSNNGIGNNGVYQEGQITEDGGIASEELGLYQVSSGKAYVKGYEVNRQNTEFVDFEKPRTVKTLENQAINYHTGASLRLNRVLGSPEVGVGNTYIVSLRSQRTGTQSAANIMSAPGEEIGLARVYDFALESGAYNTSTPTANEWDISLYDIQTFTKITLNTNHTLSTPTFVKGKYSGATGFLRSAVSASTSLQVYETNGEFVPNEPLIFNGIENSRVSVAVTNFGIRDVKSLYAGPDNDPIGFGRTFTGDVKLRNEFIFGNGLIKRSDLTTGLSTITSSNSQFPGKLKVGNILKFGAGNNDPNFARITAVGTNDITVTGVTTVAGVCDGGLVIGDPTTAETTLTDLTLVTSPFEKSDDDTLFTPLPKSFISDVDLSDATLAIRKVFNVAISASENALTGAVTAGDNTTFLAFDEERYSLIRADGTIETLTDDKFTFTNGNGTLQISNVGADLSVNQEATLIATLNKVKPKAKVKRKNAVNSLVVDKSKLSGSGIGRTTLNDGLTFGSYPFGTRVQDEKICINVPDILDILGIFESTDTSDPSAPKMTLSSINTVDGGTTDLLIGEQIKGSTSGAIAIYTEQLTDSQISYIPSNESEFVEGESVSFVNSNVQAIVNTIDVPSKNISADFTFNNGQTSTLFNYGFITKKNNVNVPTKKIKIYFTNGFFESNDTGDITTVNSYGDLDYKNDIQFVNDFRNTDILDIRPRVSNYTVAESNRSPLEFLGRELNASGNSASNILASDESITIDFSFYLGRIDKLYLTKAGAISWIPGTPAEEPDPPVATDDALELATINLPPYLFDVSEATMSFLKHRRYRMADIRKLETRIKNLEYYSALTLLETATANLFVPDEDGLNKFKSGFFVDNFTTFQPQESEIPVKNSIDTTNKELRPSHYTTSIDLQVGPVEGETSIYTGAAPEGVNIRKTGDVITLDYSEVEYLNQPFGTRSESVTPFLLNFWEGFVKLTPSSDTWVNTVRLEANVFETEGNFEDVTRTAERRFGGFDPQTGLTPIVWGGWQTNWTGTRKDVKVTKRKEVSKKEFRKTTGRSYKDIQRTTTTTFQDTHTKTFRTGTKSRDGSRQLITEQFDQTSLGDRTISTSIVPTIRSRNVAFDGKGFLPQARLFGFFDGVNVTKYCVPKLIEIEMASGSFQVGETVTGTIKTNPNLASDPPYIQFRVAVSNHKDGPHDAPTKRYLRNPYTDTQVASLALESFGGNVGQILAGGGGVSSIIPSTYSSTSTLLNVDTISLANQPQGDFFGYIQTGMILKGGTSGAEAKVTNVRLVTDFTSTVQGSFYIPNPNVNTNPVFQTGERDFLLTDAPDNDPAESTTTGKDIYTASGSVQTVQENIVSVRNAKIVNLYASQDRAVSEQIGNESETDKIGTETSDKVLRYGRLSRGRRRKRKKSKKKKGGGCFMPGTLMTLADGSQKKIEEIEVGDRLLGLSNAINEVVVVLNPKTNGRKLANINNKGYFVTEDHPFMTTDGWKSCNQEMSNENYPDLEVNQLEIGDEIKCKGNEVEKVTSIEFKEVDADTDLYNFTLDGDHTYIANNFVAHNKRGGGRGNDKAGDPLAQSFFIKEEEGVFLTSCEVFFERKDPNDIPVTLQLRTMKTGLPTTEVVPFSEVSIDPDEITTSTNGSVPTKFTFESPVYLEGGTEYAMVLKSVSLKYKVFISRIGENDLITDEFISNQPTLGSLFKSQNASTWEPSQWEDLKFNLNRAQFVLDGTVEVYNPILSRGNYQIPRLMPDSLLTHSKKVRVGLSSAFGAGIHPTFGNTIYQQGSNVTGDLVGTSGAASGNLTVTRAGIGYTPASGNRGLIGVALTTITGNGVNATANVHFESGVAVAATIASGGQGYQVGDLLGITTNLGINARLSVVSIAATSELIIDNVQGVFLTGAGTTLMYGTVDGDVGNTKAGVGSAICGNGGSVGANIPAGTIISVTDGLHITVNHKNHGMYHEQNLVTLSDVMGDTIPTKLSVPYNNSSTDPITVDNIGILTSFENVSVAATNPGYIKIKNEIIKYTGVSAFSGQATLTGITRAQDSTSAENYLKGDLVQKYELGGVSLRRINRTHDFREVTDTNPIRLDSYKIKLNMGEQGIGRSTSTVQSYPALFLNQTKSTGGLNIRATQNMPFEIITPMVQNMTVAGTTIEASIRTVSGTSINDGSGEGTDVPFINKGNESIALDDINYLNSPRVIASRVNELNTATLDVLPGDRSFNMSLRLLSGSSLISPVIDTQRMNAILTSNRIDNIISDITVDNRVDTLFEDPSSAVYISKENTLETSATSLKIIVDAHVNRFSDIRAFYAISNSQGSEPTFIPFPGYDNLDENGRVRTSDKSSGRPDALVSKSDPTGFTPEDLEYKEYTFTANELPSFKSFRIKFLMTSTNQAFVPRLTSLKVIATA